MSSVIIEDELPDDVTNAESCFARHQEHKAEIDTRQRSVNDFYQAADKLIGDKHSASADVKEKKQRLSKAWQALQTTWSEKGMELEQSKEVLVFKRDADQLEAWLNARDLDQESGDVGDSLEGVEDLLKKHEEFEQMLLAQEMKFLGITKLTQQEEEMNKQSERENEMKEEQERREREEEEERERELKERKTREQIRTKEEADRKEKEREKQMRLKEEAERKENERKRKEAERKEKEREQREEAQKLRALEEKKMAKTKAKQEEEKRLQESNRQVKLEEQRRQEKIDEDNNNKSASTPQDQQKGSVSSTVEGILQRKQELESGGRKAHARMWKTLYTVLRGNQLFFYRDKKDAQSTNYAAPPVDLTDGFCEEASDVVRRKNAFRLLCDDDSDFFFVAKDPEDLKRWVKSMSEACGQINLDIPSPPPPTPPARLPSTTTSPLMASQENGGSADVTKPYGRLPKPLITVTSFDDDEDVLIDPPPPPPVSIPLPTDFSATSVVTENDHDSENDILGDIGILPMEPASAPPRVPPAPPDFADFDDSDDEDLPVLPASPPPEFLSDDDRSDFDNEPEDSPLSNIISQLKQPTPPPRRSKTKPVPPPPAFKSDGRSRSDSRDSTDSGGRGPKPPVKPKPAGLTGQQSRNNRQAQGFTGPMRSVVDSRDSAHGDSRQEKRKGVLGNIFKKKK